MARVVPKEESGLVLAADGQWHHEGQLATHRGVTRFFHQQIRKDDRGAFYLYNRIGAGAADSVLEEQVYFAVEDTAYFVWTLHYLTDSARFEVELNTGVWVPLDLDSLTQDEQGNVYCRVLDGDEARFGRHAMTQLAPFLEAAGDEIVLAVAGRQVPFRSRRRGGQPAAG